MARWSAVFKNLNCMKGQKGGRWLQGYKVAGFQGCRVSGLWPAFCQSCKSCKSCQSIIVVTLWLACCQVASGQSMSDGKNLYQLRETVFPAVHSKYVLLTNNRVVTLNMPTPVLSIKPTIVPAPNPQSPIPNQPFLPRWSAECLPFFCRIEHDFAQKNAVPFKFRLGSVDYVDWLEGKSDFQALPPR